MADIFSKEKRSEIMSKVRGKNTGPELLLKGLLDGRVFRYHPEGVPGSPDFANKKRKMAVFIDGCFWHGCPKCYREPDQNRMFWREKIARNRERDSRINRVLRKDGWKVIRIWEHQIKENPTKVVERIKSQLSNT